jgi:biotin carboxyl carrier protein
VRDAILPALRSGFRNNRTQDQRVAYQVHGQRVEVSYADLGQGRFRFAAGSLSGECRVIEPHSEGLTLDVAGHRRRFRVIGDGVRAFVQVGGRAVSLREEPRFPEREAAVPEGGCIAPMPGKIVKVDVEAGQRVDKGQRLLVMEAMKMEHATAASEAGKVAEVLVKAGQQVEADQVLVIVEPA